MTQSIPLTEAELSLLQRVERIPFSRFQWRLLAMGGLGYTFDAMDGAMIAFILPPVTALWGLSNEQTGVLGSSAMIGYLFGAFFAGGLGDLIGRRAVMMYALAIYCVATLIAAFAPNWRFLFGWRVVASLGTGAEAAIIAPFLTEFVEKKYRGRFIGSLAGFFSFGFVSAALLGYLVIPASHEGWRIVQVISALPIVMLLWWRRSIPESPRWLIERGRTAEAEAEVEIPGFYSAAFLSEKLDRKWTIVPYMLLAAFSAYLMSNAGSDTSITIAGSLLSFFMNGTYAGIYTYTPELYPTAFRTTGMGVASSFGRIGGLSSPIVIGYAYRWIEFRGVFLITTIVLVVGAIAIAVLGTATAGKSLEQIAGEGLGAAKPTDR
jgi:putative MFS transporter